MNPKLVVVAAGIAGAAIGFGAGFLSARYVYMSKMEVEVETRTEDVRSTLSDVIESYRKSIREQNHLADEDETEELPDNASEKFFETKTDYEERIQSYIRPGEAVTKVEMIDTELDPDDPNSWEEHAAIVTMTDEETGEEIQVYRPAELEDEDEEFDADSDESYLRTREEWAREIISPEEYRKGEPGQTRERLTYYSEDDVLVDSDGIPVDDQYELVGNEALDSFGVYGAPIGQVFVRNREEYLDLEITLVEGAFEDAVIAKAGGKSSKHLRMEEFDE